MKFFLWILRLITGGRRYRLNKDGDLSVFMYYDEAVKRFDVEAEEIGYTELSVVRRDGTSITSIKW